MEELGLRKRYVRIAEKNLKKVLKKTRLTAIPTSPWQKVPNKHIEMPIVVLEQREKTYRLFFKYNRAELMGNSKSFAFVTTFPEIARDLIGNANTLTLRADVNNNFVNFKRTQHAYKMGAIPTHYITFTGLQAIIATPKLYR